MPHKTAEARREYMRQYHARRREADPTYAPARAFDRYAHPIAKAARERVRRAVRAGKLVRPLVCDECGGGGPIQGAHEDYSRPLDVRWLCRSCHRQFDNESKIAALPPPNPGPHNRDKTHCAQGHEFVEGNIYWARGGRTRVCATCKKDSERRRRQAVVS